jgi:hypothetical protein
MRIGTGIGGRRARGPAAIAALATLGLAACGGDVDSEPEPVARGAAVAARPGLAPMPADFGRDADSRCAVAQADREAIRRRRGGEQLTLDDRARLLAELAPARVQLGRQLTLRPPPDDVRGERLPGELAAAARRRGVASARAGQLWERGASEERIAEQAAAEHTERDRFVVVARRLGLTDCAEILSAKDRRRVAAAVEQGLGAPAASERCAALGERYLGERYGGPAGCIRAQQAGVRARSVMVGGAQGIDQVFALARGRARGGAAHGAFRIRLVFEGGRYRIDKVD